MNEDRKAIDWDEVKRRLEESRNALERSLSGDEGRLEAVYRRRAAQLAARRDQSATTAAAPMLVFGLGTERYGLPLGELVAVLPFANCAPVPGARPELLGVVNVRGEIRSVLDLRRLLDLPEGPERGPGYLLLMRRDDQVVALRVDSLEMVERVAPEDLVDSGKAGTESGGRMHRGLTPDLVIVLDPEAILEHPVFHSTNP